MIVISIILGTIIWGALLAFLSQRVAIFATPKAWLISWAVVVFFIFNVGTAISNSNAERALIKEGKKIEGAYKTNEGYVGLRAITDDGSINMENGNGFIAAFFDESGQPTGAFAVFYPKSNEVDFADRGESEYQHGSYKYSGIFSKKLVITTEESGKMVYKKKSDKWDKYVKASE